MKMKLSTWTVVFEVFALLLMSCGKMADQSPQVASESCSSNDEACLRLTHSASWSQCKGHNDCIAPSVPQGLIASVISSSQINLSWQASTDNVGVVGYNIYRNSAQVATSPSTSYAMVGLSASTFYTFTVAAYDAKGNTSAESQSVSATTQISDPYPPSTPTGIKATPISSSQINLTWAPSTDVGSGVTGYYVYEGSTQIGVTATTSYSDSGLNPSTSYSYSVKAYDKAGNISGYSASVTTTTLAPPPPVNAAPTIATLANATPNPVLGTTTNLSVLGSDDGGEGNLTYSWSVVSGPSGISAPSFNSNNSNAAKNTQATFYGVGSYSFLVTVKDAAGLSATSSVLVGVSQIINLVLSPSSASLAGGVSQQFSVIAKDQFGSPLNPQPTFTWALSGIGALNQSGLYTAPMSSGSATVQVSGGGISKSASVTVTMSNSIPTVVTAASATPNPVTGVTNNLSVLGADDGGEANLAYTWSVMSSPSGVPAVTFSANGTNAAKNTVATFHAGGNYIFQVVIKDAGGLSASISITVTVSQTVTGLVLSPCSVSLATGASQQFAAMAKDQFGNSMTTQPAFTWTIASGGVGTVSSTGLYTAPPSSSSSSSGSATVQVSAGGKNASASVTVNSSSTQPGLYFDSATGVVTVRTNAYNSNTLVQVYNLNEVQSAIVSVTSVDISGNSVLGESLQLALSQLTYIYYYGQAGVSNTFRNLTAVPCTAYGGSGGNMLQGGSGTDYLYSGGAGSNTVLQGMDSNDVLVGGAGTTSFYGGNGNNTLQGGSGVNVYFSGTGNDTIIRGTGINLYY